MTSSTSKSNTLKRALGYYAQPGLLTDPRAYSYLFNDLPGEISLLGAEVNFVFRMEKLASGLGVRNLLSAPANLRLHAHLPTSPYCRHALAGFKGEYEFFTY